MLLLLCTGIAIASADDDASSNAGSNADLTAPPVDPVGVELDDERTATSQTFLLPDGNRETRIYESPINYHDSEGQWKPIEEALEETAGGTLSNGQNSFDVTLPDQLDSEPVRFSIGEQWVSSQYAGSGTEAVELNGQVATYELAAGDTAFDFTGLANGLKEDIVIADPSQPNRYAFILHASTGLTPSLDADGAIDFQDSNEEAVVTIPPPVMFDSAATPAVSRAASYDLKPEGQDQWRLVVEADREWLDAPEREWPVHLDPTLTVPFSSKLDCTIGARKSELEEGKVGWRDCGAWGRKDLFAQYSPQINEKEDDWARILLRFRHRTDSHQSDRRLRSPWHPRRGSGGKHLRHRAPPGHQALVRIGQLDAVRRRRQTLDESRRRLHPEPWRNPDERQR
jgi:hypothetical protein